MLKNTYIVRWLPDRLNLSDGSTHKEFHNHDDAMNFLEDEIKKVIYPIVSSDNKEKYLSQIGKEPTQGQIECTRMKRGVVYLYGVSERYIVPAIGEESVLLPN